MTPAQLDRIMFTITEANAALAAYPESGMYISAAILIETAKTHLDLCRRFVQMAYDQDRRR